MPTSPQRPDVGSGKGDPLTGKCSGGPRGESRSSRYPFGWLGPLDPVGKHTLKAHFDAPFPRNPTKIRDPTHARFETCLQKLKPCAPFLRWV